MRKVSIFIGRFQPFHTGHYKIVKSALEQTDFLVMVLGSHNKATNTRNPLTSEERRRLIELSLTEDELSRVRIVYAPDFEYNLDKWIASVQTAVVNAGLPWHAEGTKYYLAGMKKDDSSFYLNLFPTYNSIFTEVDLSGPIQSSTAIRNFYYEDMGEMADEYFVTKEARDLFAYYMERKGDVLKYEYKYESDYINHWGPGPHMTVDACIVQAGHILLIQRGKEYGHNKWALPGGFINPNETTLDACVRELYEETKIKIPEKVLRGSLQESKLYDNPYRSNRARIMTHTFYFRLADVGELPKVKGSDDAQDARWVPISKFLKMEDQMFEDHYGMITDILKL